MAILMESSHRCFCCCCCCCFYLVWFGLFCFAFFLARAFTCVFAQDQQKNRSTKAKTNWSTSCKFQITESQWEVRCRITINENTHTNCHFWIITAPNKKTLHLKEISWSCSIECEIDGYLVKFSYMNEVTAHLNGIE